MKNPFSLVFGGFLVFVGILALLFNIGLPFLGYSSVGFWRLWPLIPTGLSLCFIIPPLLAPRNRGLSMFFIPGMPLLATSALLLIGSVFNQWNVWGYFWPVELLALALGFILSAIFSRIVWLIIPAIWIGLNGVVLQFCALTGAWGSWAVLWTIEPLAAGLTVLLTGIVTRNSVVLIVGTGICAAAMMAAGSMMTLFSGFARIGGILAALVLTGLGIALLVWNLPARLRKSEDSAPVQN